MDQKVKTAWPSALSVGTERKGEVGKIRKVFRKKKKNPTNVLISHCHLNYYKQWFCMGGNIIFLLTFKVLCWKSPYDKKDYKRKANLISYLCMGTPQKIWASKAVRHLRHLSWRKEQIGTWGFKGEESNSQEDEKSRCYIIRCFPCIHVSQIQKGISDNSSLPNTVPPI